MSKFKPRTAKIPIYQGDWQQRIGAAYAAAEAMRKRVEEAERGAETLLMGEVPASVGLRAQLEVLAGEHDAMVAEAEKSGDRLEVTLQALGRRKWNDLVEAHPPRTEESLPEKVREQDANLGVNDEAMGEALVPLSIADTGDPDISVDELLEGISSAQFDLLYSTAFALNRAVGADPKAQPRLLPSPTSSETES